MTKYRFMRIFSTLIAVFTITAVAAFAQTSLDKEMSPLDIHSVNVKELANGENFRYGRELYRKGDFAQAATVFQRILKADCTNRLAQYHLQKIIRKGQEFAALQTWLTALPCEKYNFSEEDFLPASLYYEKDKDLLIEQLAEKNRRDNNTIMSTKISQYSATVAKLEEQIKTMTASLNTEKQVNSTIITALTKNLNLAKQETQVMNNEIIDLKAALVKKTDLKPRAPDNAPHPLVNTSTGELNTLQEEFTGILARLKIIERSIADKNQFIKAIP